MILWITSIILMLALTIFTVYKLSFNSNEEPTDLQKKNAFSWAIAFVLLGIANILNIVWRYAIVDESISSFIDNISVFNVNAALFIKILHTEYAINRYKFYKGYYFTIPILSLLIFTIIISPEIVRTVEVYRIIYLILLCIGSSVFPLIFLYLALKLKGRERVMAVRMLVGALLFAIGFLIQPHNIEAHILEWPNYQILLDILLIICPILIILATIMIFRSYKNVL